MPRSDHQRYLSQYDPQITEEELERREMEWRGVEMESIEDIIKEAETPFKDVAYVKPHPDLVIGALAYMVQQARYELADLKKRCEDE